MDGEVENFNLKLMEQEGRTQQRDIIDQAVEMEELEIK
jgi:hypothetical protein